MHTTTHTTLTPRPVTGLNARHLFAWKQSALDQLFATLDCPGDQQPQGVMRGFLFAISGIDALPRPLRSLIYRLLASVINPWKGKSFHGDSGANLWLARSGSLSFAHYHITHAMADDGKPVLALDYRHPRTPKLLHPVRGEARQLSDGVWLARMRWQTRSKLPVLLYFTLETSV